MKFIGIDFETNSVDPHLCEITEVGLAFYDTEFSTSPMRATSLLCADVSTMDPEAEKVTGISLERCKTYGHGIQIIAECIKKLIDSTGAEYMVAHNAHAFDKIIFERLFAGRLKPLKWIDTMEDLSEETYQRLGTRTLEFMAARSGFLNPFPHAALSDVMTMGRILIENGAESAAARSEIPSVIVQAVVDFSRKDLAKSQGYYWQQIRGGNQYVKKWVKKIKKDMLEEERERCSFDVVIID